MGYTLNDLNQADQETVKKLPEDSRQGVIDIIGDANAKAAVLRTTLRCELSEVVKNLDGTTKPGKGGVKVLGLQRMPITLSPEQWERLAEYMPTVVAFAKANRERSHQLRAASSK